MRTRTVSFLSAVALCYSVFGAAAPTPALEAADETNPVTPTFVAGITEWDGWVYFAGRTEPVGAELWRSDGRTIELVADLNPGPASSSPFHMVALSGWLYFSAETDEHGTELWRTNGIGAELVADVDPGPGDSWPSDLAQLDGWIYFGAYNPGIGSSLWRTNGSTTERVAGTEGSQPRGMVAMDGWLYYSGYAPDTYRDLWRSNGVTAELVADIQPGDSSPSSLEVLDGWVYFSANTPAAGNELWRSNGVITELVADINPTGSSDPYDMTAMGGWVYFAATASGSDNELWRSNGATTELVSDINPGPGYSRPVDLAALGGWVYFRAETPQTGAELWRTDGVVTKMVADINPGPRESEPSYLATIGDRVFFGASGLQYLWSSDGTTTERIGVPWKLLLSDYIDTRDDEVPAWMSTTYRPDVTGVHTFALEWQGDADVLSDVRETATGRWIAANTTGDAPKFLQVALEAGVDYRIATWVVDGGAAFTMSVGTPSSLPTSDALFRGDGGCHRGDRTSLDEDDLHRLDNRCASLHAGLDRRRQPADRHHRVGQRRLGGRQHRKRPSEVADRSARCGRQVPRRGLVDDRYRRLHGHPERCAAAIVCRDIRGDGGCHRGDRTSLDEDDLHRLDNRCASLHAGLDRRRQPADRHHRVGQRRLGGRQHRKRPSEVADRSARCGRQVPRRGLVDDRYRRLHGHAVRPAGLTRAAPEGRFRLETTTDVPEIR